MLQARHSIRTLILAYCFLAVGVTWPAVLQLSDAVPGSVRTDLWNSMWSLWVFQDLVWSGEWPTTLAWLDFPNENPFVVADPLNAILMAPLIPVLGLSVSYSLLVLAHICFSGVAAHCLARHLHQTESAGWIGGCGFACAPVVLSGVHNGTSEAMAGGWLALSVLASLRLAQKSTRRRIFLAALALSVCCLGGWYAGLCAWIFWLSCVLLSPFKGVRPSSMRSLLLAGGLAFSICGPLALAMTRAVDDGQVVQIKEDHSLDKVRRTTGSADWRGWGMPGDWRSPDFREISKYDENFVHSHYLGWTLILGAGFVFLRRRKESWPLVLAGGVGAVLAMGPVLVKDGHAWVFGDQKVFPMPYFWLENLPGFESLSLLFRLGLMPALAVAVLAAGVVHFLPRRVSWCFLGLVVLEMRFLSPVAGLPVLSSTEVSQVMEVLSKAEPGAVFNYPVVGGRPYLYEQVHHRKPLAATLNLPNNLASKRVWEDLEKASSLTKPEAMQFVVQRTRRIREGACAELASACEHGVMSRLSRQGLCRCVSGVRYLVIHEDPLARPDMHTGVAEWAEGVFPVLAESGDVKVLQLW